MNPYRTPSKPAPQRPRRPRRNTMILATLGPNGENVRISPPKAQCGMCDTRFDAYIEKCPACGNIDNIRRVR